MIKAPLKEAELFHALKKEEERRFGENLRPDVREEEFCLPVDS